MVQDLVQQNGTNLFVGGICTKAFAGMVDTWFDLIFEFLERRSGSFRVKSITDRGAVQTSLRIYSSMIAGIEVHADRMRAAAGAAFSNATDLADYLARKGLPFREAHDVVGRLAAICLREGIPLESLPVERMQEVSALIESDVMDCLHLDAVVNARNSFGGTAAKEVERQIGLARDKLEAEAG